MCIKWLSMKNANNLHLKNGANLIEKAVELILKEGKVGTYDLSGSSSTSDVGDAISERIKGIAS